MTASSNYANYNSQERLDFLKENYTINQMSLRNIAKVANVSVSTIKRDCHKLGIPLRDKSDAQKIALSSGRHKHPTKGTERDIDTKNKISEKMYDKWQNEINREERSEKGKLGWQRLDAEIRRNIQTKGHAAIKEASKSGSKLEKYLLQALSENGYRASFHHEKMLGGTNLQIDLMIEDMGVAIEVNGPSHHKPIWGDKSFNRIKRADHTKRAILENYGFVLICINQSKSLSKKRKEIILGNLLKTLGECRLPDHKMYYEVDDNE